MKKGLAIGAGIGAFLLLGVFFVGGAFLYLKSTSASDSSGGEEVTEKEDGLTFYTDREGCSRPIFQRKRREVMRISSEIPRKLRQRRAIVSGSGYSMAEKCRAIREAVGIMKNGKDKVNEFTDWSDRCIKNKPQQYYKIEAAEEKVNSSHRKMKTVYEKLPCR